MNEPRDPEGGLLLHEKAAELKAAGWMKRGSMAWRSPWGAFFPGPHMAWLIKRKVDADPSLIRRAEDAATEEKQRCNLQVGDKVTVHGWGGQIEKFALVAKVGKLKVTTEDGIEWMLRSGRRWGSKSYGGPWIEPFFAGHEAELRAERAERKRKRLAYELRDLRWTDLPLDTLQAVADLVKPKEADPHTPSSPEGARTADEGFRSAKEEGGAGRKE